ncbi:MULTISPECIES: SGNH/GDSL hydrolase family protein [unclassified Simplicispira]|uniref:SGNH/GDSL hydrolase family protein n=1 Tax=unclassified Simplicispira TaxID=2630407 RepID=UPI000D5DE7C3|nr:MULTISPECIES: SGNH/GDSL hydrolase family protein [unclassified Simplicispira]PVY57302.1 phospholipase/lecithinase/hemolysin [Simplicispira sp. 125]REG18247.1 phospholipase/lecithinase/hemolysin [Simplicispira sp. 110]
MAANWMRRTALVAACASAVLLAACGSSTTESAITPDRFIAFGDAYSDVGQKGSRYTVNNGTVNNWTLQVASHYQKTLAPVSAGGLSYAQGNARISAQPDAAGDASTPTITAQIDSFLASKTFAANDIVLLNGGISDLIVGMAAVRAGTLSATDYVAQARQNGKDLAAQILRLVKAGAPHVVVSGTYDLSKTPWGLTTGQESLLSEASSRFNESLLIAINDLGAHVLYIDTAYYVNVFTSTPAAFSFSYAQKAACTSVDPGNGIGIGVGQVNSALCTASTLVPGTSADSYVFADNVYLSPSAHRQLGTFAYDKLRARW